MLTVSLVDLVEAGKPIDVLCFTEHNMTGDDIDHLKIPNYKLATHFSRNTRKGGACILVKHNLKFVTLNSIQKFAIPKVIECCAIELLDHGIVVICFYRVPKNNNVQSCLDVFFNNLNDILFSLTMNSNKKIVICGDFNINMLKRNKCVTELEQLLTSFNLKISVKEPTRPISGTCLDNIFHNIHGAKCELVELALSDHKSQILNCPVKKSCLFNYWFSFRRDYSQDNLIKFRECISQLSFSEVFETDDANSAFRAFYDTFKLFYDLCFPYLRVKNNTKMRPKWLSSGIKKGSKRKRYLLWKYRISKHPTDKKMFKEYSSRYSKIIKLTQKCQNNYYISKSNNKSKAAWNVINDNKQKFPLENISELSVNDVKISDPQQIADSFNEYYADFVKYQNTKPNREQSTFSHNSPNSFFLNPTTPCDVHLIIKHLKNTKSTGFDDICVLVLKHVCNIIAPILSYIINLCFEQGVFPSILKTSIIKPIHKNAEKCFMKNYRPIALIPVLSKVIEKVLYNNLYNYLEKYNIFAPEQKGFRKKISINVAIYEFLNMIYPRVDKRQPVYALFMDMSKAFDFVDHNILLTKLENYGIRGNALTLMKSYLFDRTQIASVSRICLKTKQETHYRSAPRSVCFGVPQGSVLGPLLFLIYVNDMPSSTSNQMVLFADDCTVIFNNKHDINSNLATIVQWLQNNNLLINIDKTKIMNFKQRTIHTLGTIQHDGKEVKSTLTTKFLGLHIDDNLKWQSHIEFVCKKLSQSAYHLYMLATKVNLPTLLISYHGLVASRLRYAIIFWGNATNWERVFKCQKRCIRAMCGLKRTDSCRTFFKNNNLLTMPSLYIFEMALFIRQNPKLFKTVVRSRSRKQLYTLNNIQHKTALYAKSVFVMAPKIYNRIPNYIKECNDYNLFKSKLFQFLIDYTFYSVSDFMSLQL